MDSMIMMERCMINTTEIFEMGILNSDVDSILHFGAMFDGGKLIDDLREYGIEESYTGVDASLEKISVYSEKLKNENGDASYQGIINTSMQEFIDNNSNEYSVVLITDIFNKVRYGDNQYQFIFKTIESCRSFSNNVIFTLDVGNTEYNVLYLISYLIYTYRKVFVKKVDETNFIFSIQ